MVEGTANGRPGTVWSFSRLELFVDPRYGCPRRYYYRYVERRPEPPTAAQERGRMAHAVIAACLKRGLSPEAALSVVPGAEELDEKGREEVLGLARSYLESERPLGPFGVEEKIEAAVDGERFVGFIDLVERSGIPRITDWKTSWEKYGPADTWQLPLYAWLFSQVTGAKKVRARLWFLRYRKEPAVEMELGRDRMEAALEWARETIRLIRAAESQPLWSCFPPKPGNACSGCGFALQCLGADPVEGASAEDLAGMVLRLERALALCREALEKAIASSGPVCVGGQHFGMYTRSQWVFPDVAAFCELLRQEGKDPWKYLEVPGWKLAPLLRSRLGKRIREIGQEVVETYLTHRDRPPADLSG